MHHTTPSLLYCFAVQYTFAKKEAIMLFSPFQVAHSFHLLKKNDPNGLSEKYSLKF